jgi:hypothetical protein
MGAERILVYSRQFTVHRKGALAYKIMGNEHESGELKI